MTMVYDSQEAGSTSITADSNGTYAGESRYRPYGLQRSGFPTGTEHTTYHFTGQRQESTIGLYYYGARWYDPALGRFIQADTIVPDPGDPQSLNRYTYCANNPVRFTDPSGHRPTTEKDYGYGRVENTNPVSLVSPVVRFAYDMMMNALRGESFAKISQFNSQCYACRPYVGSGTYVSAAAADAAARIHGALLFATKVRQGGEWDLKPAIREYFDAEWFSLGSWTWEFNYDVFGNITYGYLGSASGFSADALLEGAGAEQIGSSTGAALKPLLKGHGVRWEMYPVSGNILVLHNWDYQSDQASIAIGIQLWTDSGPTITAEQLERLIFSNADKLNAYRK